MVCSRCNHPGHRRDNQNCPRYNTHRTYYMALQAYGSTYAEARENARNSRQHTEQIQADALIELYRERQRVHVAEQRVPVAEPAPAPEQLQFIMEQAHNTYLEAIAQEEAAESEARIARDALVRATSVARDAQRIWIERQTAYNNAVLPITTQRINDMLDKSKTMVEQLERLKQAYQQKNGFITPENLAHIDKHISYYERRENVLENYIIPRDTSEINEIYSLFIQRMNNLNRAINRLFENENKYIQFIYHNNRTEIITPDIPLIIRGPKRILTIKSSSFVDLTDDDPEVIQCIICFDDKEQKQVCETNCKHSLCIDCMCGLINSRSNHIATPISCPICRSNVSSVLCYNNESKLTLINAL